MEHRFCVRHLHSKFKGKGWKGKTFKDELWGADRASMRRQFEYHMNVIQTMDQHAYDYLKKIDPKLWSRHAFKTITKSDMLLNNLAETFNAWIKDAQGHFDYDGNDKATTNDKIPTKERWSSTSISQYMSEDSQKVGEV
jgi:hypothetical protein